MKLIITLLLASALMLKLAEGANGDVGSACNSGACTNGNAECIGTFACACKKYHEATSDTPPVCKLSNGRPTDTSGDCAGSEYDSALKRCGKAVGAGATVATDCSTLKLNSAGDKCAALPEPVALDQTCTIANGCIDNYAQCKSDGTKCVCIDNYSKVSGACKADPCAGASAVTASVILMVLTLVTSRFL